MVIKAQFEGFLVVFSVAREKPQRIAPRINNTNFKNITKIRCCQNHDMDHGTQLIPLTAYCNESYNIEMNLLATDQIIAS